MARRAAGVLLPAPDAARLRLDPPAGAAAESLPAWRAAVDNARCQLEHQAARLANLELLGKHGGNAWLAHARALEACEKGAAADLAALDAQLHALHQTRKVQQEAAGAELAQLEGAWRAAVAQLGAVTEAVAALQAAQGEAMEA